MSITSYPFDSQVATETQYSQLFRELQDSGVAASFGALDLKISADGSGMTVRVQPGYCIIRGHAMLSTAVETLTIAAAESQARTDRIVVRLDPALNSITLAVVQGTPGSGTPSLTQTDTGIYEISLALVNVGASAVVVGPSAVVDDRTFVGSRVGVWTTTTRPPGPRVGQLGLNTTSNTWEFWSGSAWQDLAPVITWSQVVNKPAVFPPSAHQHEWSDINAPSSFPPSSHTQPWNTITDLPAGFPPSPHQHHWNDITNKPTAFNPANHSHSQYVTSSGTIKYANGSTRPYHNAASGSNWYAVWVENGGDFCRNTSARKFKENIRDYVIDPDSVLSLRPVIYDRKAKTDEETGEVIEGRKNEVGLIADEVHDAGLTWMVNYLENEVDGLRYDLLGVALLPVVQRQQAHIDELEARLAALEAHISGGSAC
ncbi:tail fiber domain-containing protein [Streptomyces smyrnaeus]|uniref:tail fiber domain-containing protein n=1 Tax=Streptomyces smyrnaeus TaxID=1387713 RepID=UPI0033BF020F